MGNAILNHAGVNQTNSRERAGNPRPRILYPSLIIAAISLTLLSLTGIAALTGVLPGADARNSDDASRSNRNGGRTEQVAAACTNCGTVESVRIVERKGSPSGVGAVAGGVAGALLGNQVGSGNGRTVMTLAGGAGGAYLGNEIEKNTKKSSAYQVRVRMSDGSMRTMTQSAAPGVSSGDRVRISNGAIQPI